MKTPIEIIPYLSAVRTAFMERTDGAELFPDWEVVCADAQESGLEPTISRAHLRHATAMILLAAGYDVVEAKEAVLVLGIVDDPPMLACVVKTLVEKSVYPDGCGAGDGEWGRSLVLKGYALQCGYHLYAECANAWLREGANAPEKLAARPNRLYAYSVNIDDERPDTNKTISDDLYRWGLLMCAVTSQAIVVQGLAHVPPDKLPWALMALVRYAADDHDYAYDELDRLREIVALVAEIESLDD